jgi:hypothetical protein
LTEIERLDTLAARINAEHRACETAVNAALEHALTAGDLLDITFAPHPPILSEGR